MRRDRDSNHRDRVWVIAPERDVRNLWLNVPQVPMAA